MSRTNETERILMERDGLTREEAREEMAAALDAIGEGDFMAIHDMLMLEDDCIFDLI